VKILLPTRPLDRYQQGEEKTETATMKDKRFSFFATQRKKEAKSHRTFGTLPFARHTSQRFAKVKETNLSADIIILTFNSKQCFYFQKRINLCNVN